LITDFRKQIEYTMPNGIQKQVVFFIAKYENQQLWKKNLNEISDVIIETLDNAINMVSHDDIKETLLTADKWITSLNI